MTKEKRPKKFVPWRVVLIARENVGWLETTNRAQCRRAFNMLMQIKLFLLLVWLSAPVSVVFGQDRTEHLRSMPVLINIPVANGAGIGTGFYLSESNKLFLITAKHVLFDINATNLPLIGTNATLATWSMFRSESRRHIITIDLTFALEKRLLRKHSHRDIAVIQVGDYYPTGPNAGDVVFHTPLVKQGTESLNYFNNVVDTSHCSFSTNVYSGDDIVMLGFPIELLIERSSEVDFSIPLVRKGIISQMNLSTGKFIVDSGAYGGNSGGPLLLVGQSNRFVVGHPEMNVTYSIAGIMVQYVPAKAKVFPNTGFTNSVVVNSGYSVAEPIEGALELMRQ